MPVDRIACITSRDASALAVPKNSKEQGRDRDEAVYMPVVMPTVTGTPRERRATALEASLEDHSARPTRATEAKRFADNRSRIQ
jgi:hypothetical protein